MTTPALLPLMLRGALQSPFKRPRPTGTPPPPPGDPARITELRIRAEHLTAFERVCAYPTTRDELPVTYPHILGFPLAMRLMSARAFPLPLLGLVHTSIEITQQRDLSPADTYELTVAVPELRPHHRGTEAVLVTALRPTGDTGETPVWESTSTYLARHRTDTPAPEEQEKPDPIPGGTEWRLAGDLGRRYGAASGDRNPIHLHPLTARAFGFPRAIAHGMWTVARCLAEFGAHGPVRVRARFRAPVLLPGTVTYAAQGPAFELRSGKDGGRVHLTGEVTALPR
ncbi:MaoC/PaaZ C-terminal domain-containing protein [Streptomyces sp. HUAS MG91]|uniref:MaoC/PaaZ C-terminal domain-containing protein n=1 Tax=Streptomyces tabacisoli TaxID=3156398 RepID=A0AAU8IVQ2_9ACTN